MLDILNLVVNFGHSQSSPVCTWQIYSWEFCARNHEERIPRQMIITKVSNECLAVSKSQYYMVTCFFHRC